MHFSRNDIWGRPDPLKPWKISKAFGRVNKEKSSAVTPSAVDPRTNQKRDFDTAIKDIEMSPPADSANKADIDETDETVSNNKRIDGESKMKPLLDVHSSDGADIWLTAVESHNEEVPPLHACADPMPQDGRPMNKDTAGQGLCADTGNAPHKTTSKSQKLKEALETGRRWLSQKSIIPLSSCSSKTTSSSTDEATTNTPDTTPSCSPNSTKNNNGEAHHAESTAHKEDASPPDHRIAASPADQPPAVRGKLHVPFKGVCGRPKSSNSESHRVTARFGTAEGKSMGDASTKLSTIIRGSACPGIGSSIEDKIEADVIPETGAASKVEAAPKISPLAGPSSRSPSPPGEDELLHTIAAEATPLNATLMVGVSRPLAYRPTRPARTIAPEAISSHCSLRSSCTEAAPIVAKRKRGIQKCADWVLNHVGLGHGTPAREKAATWRTRMSFRTSRRVKTQNLAEKAVEAPVKLPAQELRDTPRPRRIEQRVVVSPPKSAHSSVPDLTEVYFDAAMSARRLRIFLNTNSPVRKAAKKLGQGDLEVASSEQAPEEAIEQEAKGKAVLQKEPHDVDSLREDPFQQAAGDAAHEVAAELVQQFILNIATENAIEIPIELVEDVVRRLGSHSSRMVHKQFTSEASDRATSKEIAAEIAVITLNEIHQEMDVEYSETADEHGPVLEMLQDVDEVIGQMNSQGLLLKIVETSAKRLLEKLSRHADALEERNRDPVPSAREESLTHLEGPSTEKEVAAQHDPHTEVEDNGMESDQELDDEDSSDLSSESKAEDAFIAVDAADENAILNIACQHSPSGAYAPRGKIIDTKSGSNNKVFIIEFDDNVHTKICVRIPACGHPDKWTPHDAAALRSQVITLKMLEEKTKLPVPHIFAWDDTTDNEIGMAYLVMSFIEGQPIREIWRGGEDGVGQQAPEHLRQKILKSLAECMAELRHLSYKQLGALRASTASMDVDEIEIGPHWTSHFGEARNKKWFEDMDNYLYDPSDTSHERSCIGLKDWYGDEVGWFDQKEKECGYKAPTERAHLNRIKQIFSILLDGFPFTGAEKGESFVIRPCDFDAQNILWDVHNNKVAGIVDFDMTSTVPRYMGWSMTPFFIGDDWDHRYQYNALQDTQKGTVWEANWLLKNYRTQYARYLREASDNHPDCAFTEKSHIFFSIWQAIGDLDMMEAVLKKVLRAVMPELDSDQQKAFIRAFDSTRGTPWIISDDHTEAFKQLIRDWLACPLPEGKEGKEDKEDEAYDTDFSMA